MIKLKYGDALMIYCFGSVNCADTIERFKAIIPSVANEDIRDQLHF